MKPKAGPLLEQINLPEDLRKLNEESLPVLCDELRQFIIDAVSKNPGHFGASLGVVELTVAIHYVFNTPYDQLVWDVGHQAYPHKILTGRRDIFHTNRLYKGMSGFPKRSESEYDSFGVGHSSTSISAALGMAVASAYNGEKDKNHIAVIGDGSLTGGMAFEALNHAGATSANLLVILNDNQIAIDNNVGALKEYLTDITTSHTYNRLKNEVWSALGAGKKFGRVLRFVAHKIGRLLKSTLIKESNLFQSLNIRYFGPVDGHDVIRLTKILEDLKDIPGPKILHCITVKGKGYKYAEENQTKWHAPGLFDKETGEIIKAPCDKPMPPKYQDVFGYTLVELAELNEKIIGITPAMSSGCSMNFLMEKMPSRTFDVGIAEQHAVTFSAGLATQGLLPFCNIYSTFMQRAYDQVLHDVALQNLHVIFCLDRGGLVGEDGSTHHGVYDIAYMRTIPNMTICSPMNEIELRNLMYTAQLSKNNFPISIRYPRGNGVLPVWQQSFSEIKIGKGQKLRDGSDIAILSFGPIGNNVVNAYQTFDSIGISVAHYNMLFAKPIDEELLDEVFEKHAKIITIEDGITSGGFGSAVLEYANKKNCIISIERLGIPDKFIEHGTITQLHKECGINTEGIILAVQNLVSVQNTISK
ncbi:MAG: 1-deoxy-D-xylulose-5-phosphate synthase [Bacteroidota bacterium]